MPEWSLAALRNLLPQMSGANFGTTSPQEDADMPLTGLDRAVKYALPFSAPPPSPQDQTVAYRTPYGDITEGDIGRATDVAMATSGGGLSTKGIKAYHSSPHDFDAFDLSKIGTGEGAQVYGHGLYFAENPAVSGQGGQYWQQFLNKFSGPERDVAERLKAANFDRKAATGDLGEEMAWLEYNAKHASTPEAAAKHTQMLEALQRLESGKPVGPRTYEVNINADPAHFLDWDKPLREQSAELQSALPKLNVDSFVKTWPGEVRPPTGEALHSYLRANRGAVTTAEKLNEAGIPGIKYLDQGSRAQVPTYQITKTDADNARYTLSRTDHAARDITNTGHMTYADAQAAQAQAEAADAARRSSNYVVFNPGIVDIMKKYGLAGLAPAGAAAYGAAQQDRQQF